MKHFLLLMLAIGSTGSLAYAQEDRGRGDAGGRAQPSSSRITGSVKDAEGNPLAGATVTVLNRTNGEVITGTYADASGNFTVDVPDASNANLRITYVNFAPVVIPANSAAAAFNVVLQSSETSLDEVVVTGYGVSNRGDLTANISTVQGETIQNLPVQSFDQALQGRAAGINVTSQNGLVNNNPIIRIRGMNSITSGNDPLIIIDGVFVQGGNLGQGIVVSNQLGNLDPNSIESINILKDGAATAQYGSRGSNGVIIITTKRGKQGRSSAQYDFWLGWTETFREIDVLNASQFELIKNEAWSNLGGTGTVANPYDPDGAGPLPASPVDINWYDIAFRTGFQQNHSALFSGSSEKVTYTLGLNFSEQEGFVRNNDFQRYGARATVDYQILPWVKVGATMNLSGSRTASPNTGATGPFASVNIGRLVWATAPNVPIYLPNGDYNIEFAANTVFIGRGSNTQLNQFGQNIQLLLDRNFGENKVLQILGNAYAEVKPVKDLTLRTSFGIDNNWLDYYQYYDPRTVDGLNPPGQAFRANNNIDQWTFTNLAIYAPTFAEDHNIVATAGAEYIYRSTEGFSGTRSNIVDRTSQQFGTQYLVNNTGGAETRFGQASYFGILEYNYARRYYVSGSFRRDALSSLPASTRWGTFWGYSAAYRISEEEFFKNIGFLSFINDFRFRGSYGITGNVNFGGVYDIFSTYTPVLYSGAGAFVANNLGSENLRWETTAKTDLGFDMSMFDSRINLRFAWYEGKTRDAILSVPLPASKGVPGSTYLANIGRIQNRGIEIELSTVNFDRDGFRWTTDFNLTTVNNVVTATNFNNDDIIFATGGLENTSIVRVGHPIGALYAVPTAGVNPENGQALFIRNDGAIVQYNHAVPGSQRWTLLDGTLSRPIGIQDAVIAGNPIPKWEGGIGNTFTYKGFDLNIFFVYSGGNQIYAGTRAQLLDQRFVNNSTEILARWTAPGQETKIPRVVLGDNVSNGSTFAQTRNIFSGDFLRARNITLGYTLPKSVTDVIKIARLRVFAQVQNAFVITDYPYTDPESNTNRAAFARGIDRNSLPQARTWSAGTTIEF